MPLENIYDSIRLQLNLQSLIGISPFSRRGNKLVRNRWLQLYNIFLVFGYGAIVHFSFHIVIHRIFNQISTIGYLWVVIITFELVFTNTAYPLIVLHAFFSKHRQMDLINRIHEVDETLSRQFRIDMKPAHRFMQFRASLFLLLSLLYYSTIQIGMIYGLNKYLFLNWSVFVYITFYQIEQGTTGVLCSAMLNACYLIRSRYEMLQHVWPVIMTKELIKNVHSNNNRNRKNSVMFKVKLSKWCDMFRELCSLLDVLSETMGSILIVRLMHDFVVLLFQLYIILWMCMENSRSQYFNIVYVVAAWMVQNVVKIVTISVSAHLTRMEVINIVNVRELNLYHF